MTEDDRLYNGFLTGDLSSFDALISRYTGRLVLYLNGLTHNIHDAEDLAIETFAAIMVKKPAIHPGNFQAYLYKAARNRATRFRLLRRRMTVFDPEDVRMEEAMAVRPEDEFLWDERRQAVHRGLKRIDPETREALWLVYFEEMSYAQAAQVLDVNAKRIDNLLSRGKRLMKEGFTNADE